MNSRTRWCSSCSDSNTACAAMALRSPFVRLCTGHYTVMCSSNALARELVTFRRRVLAKPAPPSVWTMSLNCLVGVDFPFPIPVL